MSRQSGTSLSARMPVHVGPRARPQCRSGDEAPPASPCCAATSRIGVQPVESARPLRRRRARRSGRTRRCRCPARPRAPGLRRRLRRGCAPRCRCPSSARRAVLGTVQQRRARIPRPAEGRGAGALAPLHPDRRGESRAVPARPPRDPGSATSRSTRSAPELAAPAGHLADAPGDRRAGQPKRSARSSDFLDPHRPVQLAGEIAGHRHADRLSGFLRRTGIGHPPRGDLDEGVELGAIGRGEAVEEERVGLASARGGRRARPSASASARPSRPSTLSPAPNTSIRMS